MRITELEFAPFEDRCLRVTVKTEDGLTGQGRVALPKPLLGPAAELARGLFAGPLVGQDARMSEALFAQARDWASAVGWTGLAARCYSAIDLALWDLKGIAAGMPVWQLLGGARTELPWFRVVRTDQEVPGTADLRVRGRSAPMPGVLVEAGPGDAETHVDFLQRLQAAHGDSLWVAFTARGRYDYDTAMGVGHFLEEDLGADWFEGPLPTEDKAGYRRLADRLDVGLAVGSTLDSASEFVEWMASGLVRVVRPDIHRLGGLTPTLQVVHAAGLYGVNVVPHGPAAVIRHLAAALRSVSSVQTDEKADGLMASGRLVAPGGAGWTLDG